MKYIREKLGSDVIIVFVTGDEDEDVSKTMEKYNVHDCLVKPVELGQITSLFLRCGLVNPISPSW